MFDKILIANRGEIACRIMETAQRMGVACVAVYSDADAASKHVEMADEAVHIGGNAPAQSYLRGDVIVKAALDTGAQAIHPGYGFLSENPGFVQAIEKAGLTFIGPSGKAIKSMGLKDAAKVLMEEAGVPVVPGYHGADQSDSLLSSAARDIGYPVLIKAVAGGGGKGMRLVESADGFAEALKSARSEAQTAFGNSDVLVEKFVTKPRHIEVQVFGDGADAVHLFERDCSLQRRHQKVIEEAPAPDMPADVRAAMGQAAVRAAKAIGYKGAGTIEFIVDGSRGLRTDGFWFMEMNTRLQVEHPVTEAITGIDLVEWQLRVACGEALPVSQENLRINGHAFEARLYAEDVPKGFLPATGRLTHLQFPAGVRADSGVRSGDEISPYYDPMIAKVIVHGPTRDIALARLRAGLANTQVAGTVTNLAFLHALSEHAGFGMGDVDTGLIARDMAQLTTPVDVQASDIALAALTLFDVMDTDEAGFALWQPVEQAVTLEHAGEVIEARVVLNGPEMAQVKTPLGEVRAHRARGQWHAGAKPRSIFKDGNRVTLFGAHNLVFDLVDPLDRVGDSAFGSDVIEAPMPGLVRDVYVAVGDAVTDSSKVALLEAMKMEHVLNAPRSGIVAEVLVPAGTQVEAGSALIRLEEETDQEGGAA